MLAAHTCKHAQKRVRFFPFLQMQPDITAAAEPILAQKRSQFMLVDFTIDFILKKLTLTPRTLPLADGVIAIMI